MASAVAAAAIPDPTARPDPRTSEEHDTMDTTTPLIPRTHDECRAIMHREIDRNTTDREEKIVAAYLTGMTSREVGDMFGVASSTVTKIVARRAPHATRSKAWRKGKAVAA